MYTALHADIWMDEAHEGHGEFHCLRLLFILVVDGEG